MKSSVLFVTKGDNDNFKEGFSYTVELAGIMNGGVMVLFNYNERNIFRRFEDEMGAAAFAEAGEHEIASEYLSEYKTTLKSDAEQKVSVLEKTCNKGPSVVEFKVETGKFRNTLKRIRKILEDYPSIEVVILSPSLMEKEKVRSIKKLIKNMPRPVVTMSRPARA